jgi:hypothetical protein
VTFKDLKRKMMLYDQETQTQDNRLFQRLRGKPFWIWNINNHRQKDIKTNGECCFNHIIGLSKKDNEEKPFYDYESIIFHSLDGNNHIWIKKATGLGITEFMLRYMTWLCLKDDKLKGTQMCIVTGPRIDLAITFIERMKMLFVEKGHLSFSDKETVIEINGVQIEAFPSHHLDAMRGLTNVSFILLDEADFFPPGQQQDARDVSERYIAKSDPYIVMISTPNNPDGLFNKIEMEPEETCIYKRIFLDYTYGLDKIYTKEEIEKAKQSPSFEIEYNLKYLGLVGNVFHTKDIDLALQKGMADNNQIPNKMAPKSMDIDPGWDSSPFGIVITQWTDNQIHVLYAEEFERPDYNDMLSKISSLMTEFKLNMKNCKIYIDGANPSFIKSLKLQLGENPEYNKIIARYKVDRMDWTKIMTVIPVNFGIEHKAMLAHTKMIFEKESIFINPMFDKLVTSLRTAVEREGVLDKGATSYNDILDAFRLALKFYSYG